MAGSSLDLTDSYGRCPVPLGQYDRILLGHGSGGGLASALNELATGSGVGVERVVTMLDGEHLPRIC
jgi:hypothetical protein